MAKKLISIALVCCLAVSLCACGASTYGVKTEKVLVEQDYSLAFRNNDPIIYYVVAAIKVLSAEGKVDELSAKWFGSRAVQFESDVHALDDLAVPPNRTFTIGVDINSFPLVYISNDTYWGFDIELAIAVADKLGWVLREQTIEKENVYNELASGNIDCAWGGIALDPKEVEAEQYAVYGPYIHNDIVIASRDGAIVGSLKGKTLSMPSTPEARQALETIPNEVKKLKNVIRLVGGTTDCFNSLYSGSCDLILTDTCAIQYFNCH
ncbi:MAG: transporter substrate-binding domain-containing protein [Eubacteriales bacterium]|nr:transporter substrate-binding domain-containing protein [Eubacteriales bacterium]